MGELEFREPAIQSLKRLRLFNDEGWGGVNDHGFQMQLMLSGKDVKMKVVDVRRKPITIKELLYERLFGPNDHDRDLLRENTIDTSVIAIGDPNDSGEVIIGLYSDPLVRDLVHSIQEYSPIRSNDAIPVSIDLYHSIRGRAFIIRPEEKSSLRKNGFNEQRLREEFWNYVAEGDETLVRETLEIVGGDMSSSMGVYLSPTSGMRLVSVGPIYEHSNAYCWNGLSGGSRLIGMAPDELMQEDLESKVNKKIVSALRKVT